MVKYPEGHLPWYPQTRENHFCAKKNNLKCAYKMPHGGGKTANGTFQDF